MKRTLYLLCALFMTVLVSCHKDGKSIITPNSSGRPYEVLVVADDNCWMSPDSSLYHVLDTDVPGLPQAERSFRISRVRPTHFDRTMRIFRNIVIVDIQDIYTQTKLKYSRNPYSAPQMIVTIQSPSQKELDEYLAKNGHVIVDFFTRAEMNRQIKLLKKEHNELISTKVGSLFDCDIWMPLGMDSYKIGKDFFWASTAMNDLNFVMYTFPFRDNNTFTKEYFINKRDSVMKVNLPGSREGMYMKTADPMFVETKNIAVGGEYGFEARGLWEMHNDAMGGPFVSHMRVDKANARIIVVEGFVYNPGKLKRDLIRKLHASLYTLKMPSDKEVQELAVDSSMKEEKKSTKEETKK